MDHCDKCGCEMKHKRIGPAYTFVCPACFPGTVTYPIEIGMVAPAAEAAQ